MEKKCRKTEKDKGERKTSMKYGVKISKDKKICCLSVGVCGHLYLCIHEFACASPCANHVFVHGCVFVCVCVLGAACEWGDLGGKSWSRKLLEVILWPTADNSFPPGAS